MHRDVAGVEPTVDGGRRSARDRRGSRASGCTRARGAHRAAVGTSTPSSSTSFTSTRAADGRSSSRSPRADRRTDTS
jgi:hypothetical protein